MRGELQEEYSLKTYKIGEIAKMLGISTETIRNYEKKGLIRPYKEESNYRYFDIIQINHLLNLQKYQKYGYTLQEVREIMEEESMQAVEMSLENKEQDLMNEAFHLNLKLNSIHTTINCMLPAQNARQGCFLGQRPALYRLNYQKNHELITDEQVQKELVRWLKYADLPFMSGSTQLDTMINFERAFDFGFCLDQKTAEFLGIRESEIVKLYKSCPAIVFYYEATPNSDMTKETRMLLEFAEQQNLRITGESISRVIFARWGQDMEYLISHLVWVPYEKRTAS